MNSISPASDEHPAPWMVVLVFALIAASVIFDVAAAICFPS